jgi:ferredoxin
MTFIIRSMAKSPKIADQLTVAELAKVALDKFKLMLKGKKMVQVIQLKEAMADVDCEACIGECKMDAHQFQPEEYCSGIEDKDSEEYK